MEAPTGALRVALKLSLARSLADFYYWDIQRGFYFLLNVRLSSTLANKKTKGLFVLVVVCLDQGP